MKTLLLILVLSVQGSALAQAPVLRVPLKEAVLDFPRSQLQLKTNGPVSIEVNQGMRAAYETLAEIAGLNILFDPDFRGGSSVPFRIETKDILQAFDLLSERTGNFVEVLNGKTIIVAPDNATKRRDYELQVLKTFYLPNGTTEQRLSDIVKLLRTTVPARYIAASSTANAIIMRDTPNRIALAERTIALSEPVAGGVPAASIGEVNPGGSHIFTQEAGIIQESTPARSALKPTATGPVSLDTKESTRVTFETLARMAGLNIVFDLDFRSQDAHAFKVDNVDIQDALDILAMQTRTFWEVLDSKTILVSPDNQIKRRNFANLLVKTFYLPNASQREMTEVVTAIRTLLNCRYLAIVGAANIIVMRDTPGRVAFAERIMADLRRSGGVATAAAIPSGSEVSLTLNRRAARALMVSTSQLQPRVTGPFSFDMNDSVRASYEAVAAMAGLRVVFDHRFQDVAAAPFQLQTVNILDALDFLSLQTGSIWQAVNSDTILVAPDNPTVRADLLARTAKTIPLTGIQQQYINEIVTALRIVLNLRQIETVEKSLVLEDTAENIALSERIVSDLARRGAR